MYQEFRVAGARDIQRLSFSRQARHLKSCPKLVVDPVDIIAQRMELCRGLLHVKIPGVTILHTRISAHCPSLLGFFENFFYACRRASP